MEHKRRPVVWQVTYAKAPAEPLREYRFTSASDVPTRDPQKWKLEASTDGKSWTLLDQVSLDRHFPKRRQTKTFEFKNDKSFSIYRFTFEHADKSHFQVAEIALGKPGSGYEAGAAATADADAYRRSLDIANGVHQVEYERDGVTYRRTAFSSRPDQVMVIRLEADKPGIYSGRVSLADAHKATVAAKGNRITATGDLEGYVYAGGSSRGRKDAYKQFLAYEAQVLALADKGSVEADGDGLKFTNCDSLTILLGAGTNYLNQRGKAWKGPHPHKRVTAQVDAAASKPFDALLKAHTKDFSTLFGRCAIDLGTTKPEILARSTAARLAAYKGGGTDPDLEELMFQYARYMMISSSRPGSLPANLQGLWNHSNRPPWRSDYHTDVNIQMNYWFVDAANLAECFEPLADWVHSIRGVRRDETKAEFGTRGWISHAENGPFGGSTWKWSKGDAAWVAQNLWDHYAFTRDENYLRSRLYPVMKELCEFWEDHLKELPDGTLVSPDGFSPEHGPHEDGVSFDQQLVHDLFTNFIEASEILGEDAAFRTKVAAMREKLLGPQIGKWGQLQEWMVDRDDPNDKHRHLSHMIAVHPGRQISPLTTPKLAQAARVSMNARGDASTGWSRAWKISIWARLHDGDRAYKILNSMLQDMIYENLFNTHPPFQIDGNFGYAAGVCEMLLQSHTPELHLLPSLPAAWATGSARGLRARGGIEVDLNWRDGALQDAFLTADRDASIRVRCGGKVKQVDLKAGVRTSASM
jgi:alpha-L-fucosidase 2